MTSEAREASLVDGKPLKLFRFTRGTSHWYYTNADRNVVHLGETFLAVVISHTEVKDTAERNQVAITITLPKTAPVAANWRPYPPSEAITVTIWTQHVGESDVLVDWVGRVVGPKWNDTTLQLTSEPGQTRARRGGRGRVIQRTCDHRLFSPLCGVDQEGHALPATLEDVSAVTVTSAAFLALPAGRLAGGWFEWVDADGYVQARSIEEHTGEDIVLDYGSPDLVDGLEGIAFPGCDGTWSDCEYFEATDSYGGFRWLPGRDYWDGNPVRE